MEFACSDWEEGFYLGGLLVWFDVRIPPSIPPKSNPSRACVSGVVKLAYAVIMSKTPNNTSYYVNLVGLWTIPEMAGGMIAGCLPSVPKVIQGVLRSPLVLKWRSSFRNLIPSYSRGQISAAAHSHGNEPIQRVIRNSFSGVDRFPLSSFKSPMGTTASTTHSVDSTAGSAV